MNDIRVIRTEEDSEAALARIEELFDAEESTSEEEELNILVSQLVGSGEVRRQVEAVECKQESLA